jgi:hypothetical protein
MSNIKYWHNESTIVTYLVSLTLKHQSGLDLPQFDYFLVAFGPRERKEMITVEGEVKQ